MWVLFPMFVNMMPSNQFSNYDITACTRLCIELVLHRTIPSVSVYTVSCYVTPLSKYHVACLKKEKNICNAIKKTKNIWKKKLLIALILKELFDRALMDVKRQVFAHIYINDIKFQCLWVVL